MASGARLSASAETGCKGQSPPELRTSNAPWTAAGAAALSDGSVAKEAAELPMGARVHSSPCSHASSHCSGSAVAQKHGSLANSSPFPEAESEACVAVLSMVGTAEFHQSS
eukprot:CAMPEP_0202735596 /NCGR_PEP_ID=MMETSP1388-20130828/498_1 /ASSEMBLY_ACC=CAM_ASM_000864 /TAXON_ID=37098 /ORGANISM="Isochrysis sp, Strain CCMP1244" /LENGTH=110 /DNA_ID=CAMNT_0049402051 /DNA_START=281 /DNA_END=613 /DNA_ORIENTATION=+